jgi:hypothetical protein
VIEGDLIEIPRLGHPQMALLRRLTIDGFRGMPGRLSIDFSHPTTGQATSAIIMGDNGTGKSTLIDAIELALQGTYRRSKHFRSTTLPSIFNLNGPAELSMIEVVLSDNSIFNTSISLDHDGGMTVTQGCPPLFQLAPIALRRKDILEFLETPDEHRQVFFFDFFRKHASIPVVPDTEGMRSLKERLLELRKERRSILSAIALHAGISDDPLPQTPEEITEFVRQHIYRGFTKNQRDSMRYRGRKLYFDPTLISMSQQLARITDTRREVQSALSKAKNAIQPSSLHQSTKKALAEFFSAAQDQFSTWFLAISTARSFVRRVLLVVGELSETSLSVELELINSQICSPHNVLSEANLDLLALLLFLAVAKEASKRGQPPVLMLDDVLQSVDATIRVAFAELMLSEFNSTVSATTSADS